MVDLLILLSFSFAYEILYHVFICLNQRFSFQRTRHLEHHPQQSWTLKAQGSSHSEDRETKNSNLAYKFKIMVIQFKENTKTHWYFIKANKKWLKPRLNFAYNATSIILWNMKNIKKKTSKKSKIKNSTNFPPIDA
jgi:hypothetical protein